MMISAARRLCVSMISVASAHRVASAPRVTSAAALSMGRCHSTGRRLAQALLTMLSADPAALVADTAATLLKSCGQIEMRLLSLMHAVASRPL